MRKPVFAANWKMNHGPQDAKVYMRTFLVHYARRPDRSVVFFPPAVTLSTVSDSLRERPDILLGVQNIYWEDKGAFTGETSAAIARDAGARLALVGHSERRHVFGESDEETGRKCAAAVRAGLTPVLCVGEKLEERDTGRTQAVVLRQLRAGIAAMEPGQIANMLIAYEPVWAIGTGRTAKPEDAAQVHAAIRAALRESVAGKADHIPILYGGSVNTGNAGSLLASPNVDGLLVGGASLDAEAWASIART
ncbi:MAG: triose-phosphate isomerase [Gemmatimonadaceae bacterium]